MKIADLKQNTPQWKEFRKGKIAGTSLGQLWQASTYTKDDIVKILIAKGIEFKKSALKSELESFLTVEDKAVLANQAEKKLEFYNIMAERLATPADDENRMDRGHRLEDMAADKFAKQFSKELEIVGCCVSDVDDRIINSPDRLVKPVNGTYKEAVEIKNLSSARHLQALIENKIPDEFFTQKVQYFVVNPDLETLYFVFHDDRFKYENLQLHVIPVTREELGNWPDIMLRYQLNSLKEMDSIIERLVW